MSWLKLGKRLLPARKAWKVFTTKLQTKLHKLHRSKAIKKRLSKTTNKANLWHAFSLQPRFKRKRRTIQSTRTLHYHHHPYRPHKRAAPVFIDELFIEPVSNVKEHLQPPTTAEASRKGIVKNSPSAKETKLTNIQQADVPGTSRRETEAHEKVHAADDMWESLALASPQMHGINERAEEFISRFREEMQLQEMMARRRL